MSLDLDSRIIDQLNGPTVRCAPFVRFDFKSGEKRYWPGFGRRVVNGETWEGLGNLGQIGAVNAGPGQAVEEMTFTLFGDETIIAAYAEDSEEAVGRVVQAYYVFSSEDWVAIGDPIQFFRGRMGPLYVDRPVQSGEGRPTRSISTRAANDFTNRKRPPFGFYSDRDQKARTDGTDKIFTFTTRMAAATVNWPIF